MKGNLRAVYLTGPAILPQGDRADWVRAAGSDREDPVPSCARLWRLPPPLRAPPPWVPRHPGGSPGQQPRQPGGGATEWGRSPGLVRGLPVACTRIWGLKSVSSQPWISAPPLVSSQTSKETLAGMGWLLESRLWMLNLNFSVPSGCQLRITTKAEELVTYRELTTIQL